MKRPATQLLVGALLVAVGALLLLRSMHVWIYNSPMMWAVVMTAGGLVFALTGIASNRHGRIFIGSWAFLYGIFLWLRLFDLLAPFPHIKFFAMLMALAMSLLMLFFLEPKNFGNLVSALCVGAFALWVFFEATNAAWADDLHGFFRMYWPVALILFGLNALIHGRRGNVEVRK